MILFSTLTALLLTLLTSTVKSFKALDLGTGNFTPSSNRSSNLRQNCSYPCNTCNGYGAFNCTSCYSGNELAYRYNPFTRSYGYTCIKQAGTCHPTCQTCNNTDAYSCTSCYEGWTLLFGQNPATHLNGTYCDSRAQGCRNGTYFNSTNATCEWCDSSCRTCNGSTSYHCRACYGNNTLDFVSSWQGRGLKCVNRTCGNGTYFDEYYKECENCDYTCKTCTGRGRSNCTSCYSGFNLTRRWNGWKQNWDYLCLRNNGTNTTCPSGQWYNNRTNHCQNCSSVCSSCNGGGMYNCTSCNGTDYKSWERNPIDGRYGYTCLNNNRTNTTCPWSQYWSNYTSSCLNCSSFCLSCNGAGDYNCTSCRYNETLVYRYNNYTGAYGWTCRAVTPNCTDTQYFNNRSNSCGSCYSPCKGCSGPGSYNCSTCYYGDQLTWKFDRFKRKYGWTCLDKNTTHNCTNGQYFNNNTGNCSNCSSTCMQCDDGGDYNCTACYNGTYLAYRQSPSGYYGLTCVSNSSISQNLNSLGEKCHWKCAEDQCEGPTEIDCLKCRIGFGFVGEWREKEQRLVQRCKELEMIGDYRDI